MSEKYGEVRVCALGIFTCRTYNVHLSSLWSSPVAVCLVGVCLNSRSYSLSNYYCRHSLQYAAEAGFGEKQQCNAKEELSFR